MIIKGLQFLFPNLPLLHKINCFKTVNLIVLQRRKIVGHVKTSHWELFYKKKETVPKRLQSLREITLLFG